MSDLLIVGCVSVDTIRVPGRVVEGAFGGSAGYAAVAASFFTRVHLVSNIGHNFPQDLMGQLNGLGMLRHQRHLREGIMAGFGRPDSVKPQGFSGCCGFPYLREGIGIKNDIKFHCG